MNMDSTATLLFVLTLTNIIAGDAQNVFVNVQCQAEKVGQYGQHTLLECVVKTTHGVAETAIRVVTWKKEKVDKSLLVFHKQKVTQQPGYTFAESSWNDKNMNVSLLITNTTVANAGVYMCMVMTNRGDGESRINLKVTAKYSAPTIRAIPEKIAQGANGTLICETRGGYPKGQIHWFGQNSKDTTDSNKMEVEQEQDGLFRLSSRLTLQQGSSVSKYTCVVFNASGVKEAEAVFKVEDQPLARGQREEKGLAMASKIVAPLVVIGSLIAGLLLVLLFCWKRSKHIRRYSTAPIMGFQHHRQMCQDEPDVKEGSLKEKDTSQQSSEV